MTTTQNGGAHECADCTHFLALTASWPGGWARSTTAEKALAALRADWGPTVRTHGYMLYRVHPETEMDELASFVFPRGHAPTLVEDKSKRGRR